MKEQGTPRLAGCQGHFPAADKVTSCWQAFTVMILGTT